ncbi:MAG: hypothetical protein P1U56_18950 [Saprospiraceae bacterium]|nr:hypothetical protein [Saprospiraceae bacterium]
MKLTSILQNRVQASISVFLITLLFILWEHFNGGVISHHLLARKDLPSISNWWGLVTIPVLFWVGVFFIQRRNNHGIKSASTAEEDEKQSLKQFLAALIFGVIASLLWEFNQEAILQYYILFPLLLAFFRPVHLPEYIMGFVLGMAFTFGGILPILFATFLSIIGFLIHTIIGFLRKLIASLSK